MNFSGIFVALITPYTEDLSIDWQAFEKYVDWMCAQGVQGIVVAGTTGEGMALTPKEHRDLVQCAFNVCQKRAHVMAGVSCVTPSQALSLIEAAHTHGAESVLVLTPPYIKPSQEGLIAYYREIHTHSYVPIILYNNPGRTCVNLEIETLYALAQYERIKGIKDSTTDLSRPLALSSLVKEKQWGLFSGEDSTIFPFLASGGNGIISIRWDGQALICVFPWALFLESAEKVLIISSPLVQLPPKFEVFKPLCHEVLRIFF